MSSKPFRAAVLTASDQGAAGKRADESGPLAAQMLAAAGYTVAHTAVLPDDEAALRAQLLAWSQSGQVDLILTTGGTGLSPRDQMPEATLAVATRDAPGIAQAIRAHSLAITPRAMLSRGVSVVCQSTLIVNLPGSPKAVRESLEYLLPPLSHGLEMLTGAGSANCATKTD